MRVTETMAQVGEVGAQGGIVFVNMAQSTQLLVSLGVWDPD